MTNKILNFITTILLCLFLVLEVSSAYLYKEYLNSHNSRLIEDSVIVTENFKKYQHEGVHEQLQQGYKFLLDNASNRYAYMFWSDLLSFIIEEGEYFNLLSYQSVKVDYNTRKEAQEIAQKIYILYKGNEEYMKKSYALNLPYSVTTLFIYKYLEEDINQRNEKANAVIEERIFKLMNSRIQSNLPHFN